MLKVSAVIICYNEERNIARCIESLLQVVDEIVVVDSGSNDRTLEILKSYNVRVVFHAFEGHIQQKNYALTQASHDFVLSLDADECLSEELKKSILDIKTSKTIAQAYSMNRLTNYCGKWIRHCGWYPDEKLRFFDRRIASWGGENPHDKIMLRSGLKAIKLKGDILHYSYYSISDHLLQIEKFTTIAAHAAFQNGKKSSLLKIVIAPLHKFIRDYFIKLGFLDGFEGFVICRLSAMATFSKYVKLRMLNKGTK